MEMLLNVEVLSIFAFFIGFTGLIISKTILKSVIAISIMEASVVMFMLSFGTFDFIMPPIGESIDLQAVGDPLPQALVITAIIIGVALTAVNLIMMITLSRGTDSTEWDIVKRLNS